MRAQIALISGLALALSMSAACKRKPQAPDAGPTGVASAITSGPGPTTAAEDGGNAAREDSGAAHASGNGATADFHLVAVGKGPWSKLVWLRALGTRIWMSAKQLDAYADGDGPLTQGPDLMKGLPFDFQKQIMSMVGDGQNMVVVRSTHTGERSFYDDTVAFAYVDGKWKKSKPLKYADPPQAVVAWNGGALIVNSQTRSSNYPSYHGPDPGTVFEHVAWDGTLTRPKIDVDHTFMAWAAASDGHTLSLLGTLGSTTKKAYAVETNMAIARGAADGKAEKMTANVFVSGFTLAPEAVRTRVREAGGVALLTPPWGYGSAEVGGGWRPNAQTIHVARNGKVDPLTITKAPCAPVDAALVGATVIAMADCYADNKRLMRGPLDGGPFERVALTALVKDGAAYRAAKPGEKGSPCAPEELVQGRANDLWVRASCGGVDLFEKIPAVFRLGHPQDKIVVMP
jgi:hypothetical protein